MLTKAIKSLTILTVFAFPILYIEGFVYPGIFPRTIFVFLAIELLLFLFLWRTLSRQELTYKKSYLSITLLLYIIVLFVSAIMGADFGQSFWSGFFRMTGIVTWLHYFAFLFVVSSVFTEEKDWLYIFRAILFSGFVLALVSYLGIDGFNVSFFSSSIKEGGSLFGNTSYSGAYYLLVLFLSLIGFSLESGRFWKSIYALVLLVIFFNPDLFNFAILKGDIHLTRIFDNPALFFGMARASALVVWMGLFVLVFLFLLHKFVKRKLVVIFSFLVLLLISGVYLFSFNSLLKQEGKIYDIYLKESGPARPLVWDIAEEGIRERPLLGYGPENFSYVYQKYLNSKIINIEESAQWFDNVHNFTLAELISVGVIGVLMVLVIFCLIIFLNFRLYFQTNRFYFLIIPFIFLFHFLQMQTFFETDSTLFLVFVLFAFIICHEKNKEWIIPSFTRLPWFKLALVVLLAVAVYFFVHLPMKENLLVSKISHTENRSTRLTLEQKLCCLKVDPLGSLTLLGRQFIDNTAPRQDVFEKTGLTKNVAEEYSIYLEAYKSYFYKYKDNYRYFIEYANMINTAFMFGVDELKHGEELLSNALEISDAYPHPYLFLSINLYYQGRYDEALRYAQQGYDIDRTIKQSKEVYDFIVKQTKIKGNRKTFIYLTGI